MSKPAPPIYRTTNWRAYNAALRQRGSLSIKTPAELDLLRRASDLIDDSMQTTIRWAGEGRSKHEIIERLRVEETQRGL